MDPSLTQFYRQYLQQVNEPVFPTGKTLLNPYVQEQVYHYMFDPSQTNLPPVRYRRRILKTITERIESAIEDPDEDVGDSFSHIEYWRLASIFDFCPLHFSV